MKRKYFWRVAIILVVLVLSVYEMYPPTPQDLERYQRDHAAAFRADFAAHFPAGAIVTRVTWTEIASWE